MAGDEEGLAAGGQIEQQLAHLDARLRVEAVGRLVEDQHFRVVQQRPGDSHALLHAVAQRLDVQIVEGACPRQLQHLADPPRPVPPRQAERRSEKVEVLADAHVVIRTEHIRHVADQPLDLPRLRDAVGPGDRRRAARRPGQADEDLDGRRLARAVRPHEAEDLPSLHGQGQTVQRHDVAVAFRQVFGFDDRLTRTHAIPLQPWRDH